MTESFIAITTLVGINVLLGWGVYLVFMAGQLSLGQGAFMAIGAYTASVLTVNLGIPLAPAMLVAGVVAAAFGVAIGFPSLRVRGTYLALVTLGVGEAVRVFFQNF